MQASVDVVRGLSSCGLRALEHRLSSCDAWANLLHGMWYLPGPGLEPMSPALAGGFLTAEPQGKSLMGLFNLKTCDCLQLWEFSSLFQKISSFAIICLYLFCLGLCWLSFCDYNGISIRIFHSTLCISPSLFHLQPFASPCYTLDILFLCIFWFTNSLLLCLICC